MSINFEALKQQMILLKQVVMMMDEKQRKEFAVFCMALFKEIFDKK